MKVQALPHTAAIGSISRLFTRSVLSRYSAFALAILTVLSAIGTYVALTYSGLPNGTPTSLVVVLITANIVLLCLLCAVLFRQVYHIWRSLHSASGAKLQTRLVTVFTLVALVPGVTVSLFAGYLFYFGIQSWFDTKVSTALEESVAVAEGYLSEHRQAIRADIVSMAHDISRQSALLRSNPLLFNKLLNGQAALRGLTEAVVFQPGRTIARSSLTFSYAIESLPLDALQRADGGEVVVLDGLSTQDEVDDRVRAVVRLDGPINSYLLVGRFVDSDVIAHMERTRGAVSEYRLLQQQVTDLQWQFLAIFVLVTLMMLAAALWYGLNFASKLLRPIAMLNQAAERIRSGDMKARVEESHSEDELAELGRAFNRMTGQLDTQRTALMDANQQLDIRRRFIETVLTGVSAGVIALDSRQYVSLCNRSAEQLLDIEDMEVQGKMLTVSVPEMQALLDEVRNQPTRQVQADITVERDTKSLTLNVRITAEVFEEEIEGYIVTFDDITQLVNAQRRAAWADVARRIAHEIKNPLTPIQLSTERLKRKYGKHLSGDDKEQFNKYTDTIARNVQDIGSMVEEFVSFARMPSPVFEEVDLVRLINDTVFLEKNRDPSIRYVLQMPDGRVLWRCDRSQMGRLLTNLLKNAEEAFNSAKDAPPQPRITIRLEIEGEQGCRLTVEDNGKGFPPELMSQLTEPYVTTRPKGTGLGLAIVRKVLEDHHGSLILENREEGGARIIMLLPGVATEATPASDTRQRTLAKAD